MENSTKALLIAAAVLIVIVIIALGAKLLNAGDDVSGQAGTVADSTSAQTFNAQFSAYDEKTIKGSNVRALFALVKTSNENDPAHEIIITFNGWRDITQAPVNNKNTYPCEFIYDTNGYLQRIKIGTK